jgi:tripartite-type tricarboxylate transporter receptor subunit TctC
MNTNFLRRRALVASLPCLLASTRSTFAQSPAHSAFPTKPIRIIVPFTPGGTTDILARALIAPLSSALKTSIVIDNKPGAGGVIGAEAAARAEADGHTLMMGHIGTLGVNPSLYPKLPYDALKSFVPVAWVARVPNVLVTPAQSGITSLAQLIERAKQKPLNYGSGGNGSAAHIAAESLKLRAKFSMQHVPYKGTAPSLTGLLSGDVDVLFTGAPPLLPHLQSGRLRALAVSSAKRLTNLPDVPTVAESGFPGFEADQWYGVVAPAGTPTAIVTRLNAEINAAIGAREMAQQLAQESAEGMRVTPAAFGQLIAAEIPRWAEVIRQAKIAAD